MSNLVQINNPTFTAAKKSYHTPHFTVFGDIRDLTLAPSPGNYETARDFTHRWRPCSGSGDNSTDGCGG